MTKAEMIKITEEIQDLAAFLEEVKAELESKQDLLKAQMTEDERGGPSLPLQNRPRRTATAQSPNIRSSITPPTIPASQNHCRNSLWAQWVYCQVYQGSLWVLKASLWASR